MTTATDKELAKNRWAGLSVMAGCVAIVISMLLLPGGLLIESGSGGWDFDKATSVLRDYPVMADLVTFLASLATIGFIVGLMVLIRRRSGGGPAEGAVRVGAVLMLAGYVLFLLYQGLRHIMVQVLEHEIGGVTPDEETAIAYSLHAVSIGAGRSSAGFVLEKRRRSWRAISLAAVLCPNAGVATVPAHEASAGRSSASPVHEASTAAVARAWLARVVTRS